MGPHACLLRKKLSVTQRRKISHLFHLFEEEATKEPEKGVWNIDNVKRVMELGFVNYCDITKLRSCILASKEDPSGMTILMKCVYCVTVNSPLQ